jgi:hypothetical protein
MAYSLFVFQSLLKPEILDVNDRQMPADHQVLEIAIGFEKAVS